VLWSWEPKTLPTPDRLRHGDDHLSDAVAGGELKALEADGVVRRTAHPVVPPHVEYQLTDLGEQLKPALEALRDWSGLRSARLVGPQA
jgi:DNA-binding HxlR family transcriptional regulator